MRKSLSVLLFLALLAPSSIWAWMSAARVSGGGAVAGCDATKEIGDTTVRTSTGSVATTEIWCFLHQSDCANTGAAATAYLYSSSDAGSVGKVCVYSDLGTAGEPDSSDLKLSCSGTLNDTAAGWASSAMDTAASISPSTNYWVCVTAKTAAWPVKYTLSLGTCRYKSCTGCVDTPPDNLGGSWTSATAQDNVYVTIGE